VWKKQSRLFISGLRPTPDGQRDDQAHTYTTSHTNQRIWRNYGDRVIIYGKKISPNIVNAVGEGLNRIIKIIKNRASGFRTLNVFADMIFLTVGDVDIPAQIPVNFSTI
jgi:hypothetical protein